MLLPLIFSSLALLTPPGEWGADIVFGTTQRLGTPIVFMAVRRCFLCYQRRIQTEYAGTNYRWSKDKYGKSLLPNGFTDT